MRTEIHESLWNGRNLKPPLMYIDDVKVLGSRSESEESFTRKTMWRPLIRGRTGKTSRSRSAIPSFRNFSKTAPFTPEEVARCRAAQPAGRVTIVGRGDSPEIFRRICSFDQSFERKELS